MGLSLFWLLLVLGGVFLERWGAPTLETCFFHRLTSHPCPTCGSTRAVLALGQGHWGAALAQNPLMTLGLLPGGATLVFRLLSRRRLRLELGSRELLVLVLGGVGLLLLNWAWVLRRQG